MVTGPPKPDPRYAQYPRVGGRDPLAGPWPEATDLRSQIQQDALKRALLDREMRADRQRADDQRRRAEEAAKAEKERRDKGR